MLRSKINYCYLKKGASKMKYFLHDSNAFNDEKVTELFMKFGYEGLGLFYTLLEKIAQQEKPIKTSVLKSQLKVGKKLDKCWNFMESIDIISSNNGTTFNKQLLNFSEKYKIKKENNAKRFSEWRDKQDITKTVTHYESVRNACKVNESKVNESNIIIREKLEMPISDFNEKFLLSIPEEWRVIVRKWLDFKKEKNQSYKGSTSLNTMFEKLKKFSNENPKTGALIIENSISNNYSGFFEPKEKIQHPMILHQSNQQVENF
jgi:hypothetical protein